MGGALVYSTYHGRSYSDESYGIAVDSSGNAYVTGVTNSPNLPRANPLQPAYGGGFSDAFITKIGELIPGELVPTLEITMSAATYIDGEAVTVSELRLQNPTAGPVAVKLRAWLSVPGIGDFIALDIGADGSFFLPPNLNQNMGPISLFVVTPAFPPKGNWQFNSRMENPTTGVPLSQDINSFVIQ